MTDTGDLTFTCPTELEVVTSRTFAAPREHLFDAFTRRDILALWWGVGDTETIVEKMDLRTGGSWRLIEHAPDGTRLAVGGEYRIVQRPELFVYTFEREAMPGNHVLNSATFETVRDGTKVEVTSLFTNKTQRDEMLENMRVTYGAEYPKLDELLADWDARVGSLEP